jgi:hypothetical protein
MKCLRCEQPIYEGYQPWMHFPLNANIAAPGNYHVGCGMVEESGEDGDQLRYNLRLCFDILETILKTYPEE